MRTNCLIFAILLYRRRAGRRWYFKMRRSDHGWFPHFLVEAKHHVISYKPFTPEERKCPPWRFDGRVCWGDKVIKHP